MQPFDAPPDPASLARIIDQLPSEDMLLFASDFPHWQYDGEEMLPRGFPDKVLAKILSQNALATYQRLAAPPGAIR
jgi:predicted TIM-barrel fold metal-dependent hydrolase